MPGPIVFVGTHRIHEGKLDIAKKASADLAQFVRDNHPRVLQTERRVPSRPSRERTLDGSHHSGRSALRGLGRGLTTRATWAG